MLSLSPCLDKPSAYGLCAHLHKLGGGGGVSRGRRLGRIQVNSEQVGLESLAEAVEQLCSPNIGRELVGITSATFFIPVITSLVTCIRSL